MMMKKRRLHRLVYKTMTVVMATLMVIPPQFLDAHEPAQPVWAKAATAAIKADFESRLDAVENDPTRQIVGGNVISSNWQWASNTAVPIEPGTAYYVKSPDSPNLDTMVVGTIDEAHSAYAAAMQSGRWAGINIIHVANSPTGLAQMEVGGKEVPIISYSSIDEIGNSKADFEVAELYAQHLQELDPTGQMLASYNAEKAAWLASMDAISPASSKGDSEVHYVRQGSKRGCTPCNLKQLPSCDGGAYAYQQVDGQAYYRQASPRGSNGRTLRGGGNCENCRLGILAGPRNLLNGNFIKNRPRKQEDFMQLSIPQRMFARVLPRVAYAKDLVGCQTAEALVGQRFLAILVGLSFGIGGGGAVLPPLILQNDRNLMHDQFKAERALVFEKDSEAQWIRKYHWRNNARQIDLSLTLAV